MSRTPKPSLVQLEDRTTPTMYRWNPPGDNLDWRLPGNWDEAVGFNWKDGPGVPGGDDSAVFDTVPAVRGTPGEGVQTAPNCVVDQTTFVTVVGIRPGFTSNLLGVTQLGTRAADLSTSGNETARL